MVGDQLVRIISSLSAENEALRAALAAAKGLVEAPHDSAPKGILMRHVLASVLLSLALPGLAHAQSTPGFSYGQVPTAGQWNNAFARKQDLLVYAPVNRAGDTMMGHFSTSPSTINGSGFTILPGIAPSAPNNGDIWATGAGFFGQVGSATMQFAPLASPTFTGTAKVPTLAITGTGSTGDVSGMSVAAPSLAQPVSTLSYLISWLTGVSNVATLRASYHGIIGTVTTLGYYTAGDGGAASYRYDASDTASADDGCTVIVSTADGSRWKLIRRGALELHACGAKGDDSTDDTAAVRTWFGQPGAITDTVGGVYRIAPTSPITGGTHTTFMGAGRDRTTFKAMVSNQTLFYLNDYHQSMRRFGITTGVTQVAPSLYINILGPEDFIEDFELYGHYQGVLLQANAGKVLNGRMTGVQSGGIDIRAEGGDNSQIIDGLLAGAETSPNIALACIRVRNNSALMISNTSCINQSIGLLIDPATATASASDPSAGSVFSFNVENAFFDTGKIGIAVLPSGTASVVRGRFVNVWTSSGSSDGIQINNTGTGSVKGLYFVAHHSLFNKGSGISTAGTASDIQISGTGCFAGNAFGGYFAGTVDNIHIGGGATFGHCVDAAANTSANISLNSGLTNLSIVGAALPDGGLSDGMTATSKIITGNTGYNPRAKFGVTVGASPWTYTNNTGSPVSLYINGGTVGQITADGDTVATATNTAVQLSQGSSAVVTYSAAPNAEVRPY